MTPLPWQLDYVVNMAYPEPFKDLHRDATTQYQKNCVIGCRMVELQIARMMKEAVDHVRTK